MLWIIPGPLPGGESLEAAMKKMEGEIRSYRAWQGLAPALIGQVLIVQDAPCDLQVRDADSDVLFSGEGAALSQEEYAALKALALKSAADFHALYEAIPDKDRSAALYGMTASTQRPCTGWPWNSGVRIRSPICFTGKDRTMVIGIFGESCTGKSTLADRLKELLCAEVFSGRDYLRLAKNEVMAKKLFEKKLSQALTGPHVIYVISEQEHLALLPEGAVRILVSADLDTIKQRFAQRMRGSLPAPVAAMLEKKHGCFDAQPHNLHFIFGETDPHALCQAVLALCGSHIS